MKDAVKLFSIVNTLLVALVVFHIAFYFIASPILSDRLPIDTVIRDISEEEEKAESQLKKEWIEHMHQAAPGVDWKSIEFDNRWKKYQLKLTALKKGDRSNKFVSVASGALTGEWIEKGSRNLSGRIHVADMDTATNMIYCGSSGGNIWKGNMDGTGWTSLNDNLQMSSIKMVDVLHHSNGVRLLVADGGDNFFFSDDDGTTWDTASGLAAVQDWGYIMRALVVNNAAHTIYLLCQQWDYVEWGATTCIYRSDDLGASFNEVQCFFSGTYGASTEFDIWTPVNGDSTVYFLNNNNLYTLNYSNGVPFFLSAFSINNIGYTMLTGCQVGGTTYLYAYIAEDIYRSDDGGINWTFKVDIAKSPFNKTSFSSAINTPDQLFFGDVECYRSPDGGNAFFKVNTWGSYYGDPANKLHADIPAISSFLDADGTEYQFISTDGGLYLSADLLLTVENLSMLDLNVSQYYSVYTNKQDPNYIYLGSQDQGFQRSNLDTGGTVMFDQVISGDYGHIVSSDDGNSIWMVYPGFIDYYADAKNGTGDAWWEFNGTNPFWIPPLMADPDTPNICYMAGGSIDTSGSKIMKFEANGSNMKVTQLPFDFSSVGGDISAMETSPFNSDIWYVLTDNGQFLRSVNRGQTWIQSTGFTGPGPHYFYGADILASSVNAEVVYIAGSGYSNPAVYKSVDYGSTFAPMDSGLPPTLVHQLAADTNDSFLFAATEAGAYVYVRQDSMWYDLAKTAAPDQTYWSVEYIPLINTARFASYGRGVWDFAMPLPDTAVVNGMAENGQTLQIMVFPNPTTGEIMWNAPRDEVLGYTIFDLKGKRVLKRDFSNHNEQRSIHIQDLKPATYILGLDTQKGMIATRFVKL